jgi:hypothetical protein
MAEALSEAEQERDVQRTFVLSLAGFSFTAVAGLAVLDAAVRVTLQLPAWYVLVSFLAFFGAFNMQSYKASRWQNELSTGLIEIGALSLMLALIALLFSASFSPVFQWVASTITFGVWAVDHFISLRLSHRYLDELNEASKRRAI